MRDLTWADFKALVEAAGVQDTDTIEWFDFSYPAFLNDGRPSIEVFRDTAKHSITIH